MIQAPGYVMVISLCRDFADQCNDISRPRDIFFQPLYFSTLDTKRDLLYQRQRARSPALGLWVGNAYNCYRTLLFVIEFITTLPSSM